MADYLDYNGLQLYDTLLKSDANPSALGTVSAGTSKKVSRADHVHPMPEAGDIMYDAGKTVEDKIDDLAAAISGGQDFSSLGTGVVYHTSGNAALSTATASNIVGAIGSTPVNRATADANGDTISTTYAKLSDIPSDFTGATISVAGAHGLVPAPAIADRLGVLWGDGSWGEPEIYYDSHERTLSIYHNFAYIEGAELPLAASSLDGLMSASDYGKLAALPTNATLQSTYLTQSSAASTYALKTDITGAYKYKGSVTDAAGLPASPATGDVYNLVNETVYGPAGTNVAWTGSAWDALGGLFTISSITTAQINALFA